LHVDGAGLGDRLHLVERRLRRDFAFRDRVVDREIFLGGELLAIGLGAAGAGGAAFICRLAAADAGGDAGLLVLFQRRRRDVLGARQRTGSKADQERGRSQAEAAGVARG